jgi:hypothetical protein
LERAGSPRSQCRRVSRAFLFGAALACAPAPFAWGASAITKSAITNPGAIAKSGNTFTVTPDRIGSKAAFNDFAKFNLDAGDVANLNFGGAPTLVNVIRDTAPSQINGQVNAVNASNKIGGNLIFANSNGILVGASGAIHAGSITLLTPTAAYLTSLTADTFDSHVSPTDPTAADLLTGKNVPISASGVITVSGKLLALDKTLIKGQSVTIDGAQILTGSAAVTALSQITNLAGVDAGTGLVAGADGSIEIVADANSEEGVAMDNSFDAANYALNGSDETPVAKVIVKNSTLTAPSGDITLTANATHSGKSGMLDSQASVSVDAASTLTAGGAVAITATATSTLTYKKTEGEEVEKLNLIAALVPDPVGSGTGDTLATFLADYLTVEGQIGYTKSDASVSFGGTINATGDVTIATNATSDVSIVLENIKTGTDGGYVNVNFIVSHGAATAQTTILDSAKITSAAGNITISSASQSIQSLDASDAEAEEGEEKDDGSGSDDEKTTYLSGTIVVANTNSTASTTVAANAQIAADADVVISSENTDSIELAIGSEIGGNATLSAALSFGTASANTTVDGTVSGATVAITADSKTDANSISIVGASVKAKDEGDESAESGSGEESAPPLGSLTESLNKKAKDNEVGAQEEAGLKSKATGEGGAEDAPAFEFDAVGAVALSSTSRSASATVSGSARITTAAAGDVRIASSVDDNPRLNVNTSIEIAEDAAADTKLAIAGAAALVFNTYNAQTLVASGAQITAGGNVGATSRSHIGAGWDWVNDVWDYVKAVPGSLGGFVTDAAADAKEKLSLDTANKFGLTDALDSIKNQALITDGLALFDAKDTALNTVVQSKVKNEKGGEGYAAVGGSIGHFSVASTSTVTIAAGASVTTGADAALNVRADNLVKTMHLVGEFEKDTSSPYAAIGGSYFGLAYDLTTAATIGDGATVNANALNVIANTDTGNLSAAAAGGLTKALVGVNGSVSVTDISSATTAQVSNAAQVTLSGASNIEAVDDVWNIAIAGALSKADGAAIGVAVAVNLLERDTRSGVFGTGARGDGFFQTGTLAVNASNDGLIVAAALAGGVVWQKDPSQSSDTTGKTPVADKTGKLESTTADINANAAPADATAGTKVDPATAAKPTDDSANQKDPPSFGVGISGSASVNLLTDNAAALIFDSAIELTATDGALQVGAVNDNAIYSLGGSFSIAKGNSENKVAVGIAGAFTYNQIDGAADAAISGSSLITRGDVAISAENSDKILTLAGGASGALSGGSSGGGVAVGVAGAVTLNLIESDAFARLEDTLVDNQAKHAVSTLAANNATVGAIAGSVSFAKGSTAVALGADIAINRILTGTRATQNNVTFTNALSALTATATNDSAIYTVAGAVSVSVGGGVGVAGAGTFAYAQIGDTTGVLPFSIGDASRGDATEAAINNVRKAGDLALDVDALTLSAANTATIWGLAGAVSASASGSGVAVGAAWVQSGIASETRARLGAGSDIATASAVSVAATNESDIYSAAVAIGVTNGIAGVSGSLNLSFIADITAAEVAGALVSTGAVSVLAADKAVIYGGAGGVGIGTGTAGIGIGVSFSSIENETLAQISGAGANVSGANVTVAADSLTQIGTLAIGGGAGGTVGVGVSATANIIKSRLAALVADGAHVSTAGALKVSALDKTTIYSAAGAISVAGVAAVGGAVSYNFISGSSVAAVTGAGTTVSAASASITSGSANNAAAKSWFAQGINSLAVAGGGAGTVAVNGATTINTIERGITAEVASGASITTTGGITLEARDAVSINSVAGAVSGAGTAAVAGAFAYNNISGKTIARASGATVNAANGVTLSAVSAATIRALAASGSGAGTVAGAASVTVNNLSGETSALIAGGTATLTGGALLLAASDTSEIDAIIVGVGGAGAAQIGASASTNTIGGKVSAEIKGGAVVKNSGRAVTLSATSTATIKAAAAAAGGAGGFAGNAAVTLNTITRSLTAEIASGSVTSGALSLKAENGGTISSLAGAASGSGAAAIAGAVSTNEFSGKTVAQITGGTVAASTVSLAALFNAKVNSAAISGSGAGTFAAAVNVSSNNLNGEVSALIKNAKVSATAGSVALSAKDTSAISTGFAAVAGAGVVAIGGTALTNNIYTKTIAQIDGISADVAASTDITLDAASTATIKAAGAAAAFSGGVSVSGLWITNNIGGITTANIGGGAKVVAQNNVSVSASRTGSIEIASTSVAGALAASIGVTALANNITQATEASITGTGTRVSGLAKGGTAISYGSTNAKGVVVKAVSTSTITGYTGGVSASGGAAVSGAGIINTVGGSTKALITGANINSEASANAAQSVAVFASDTTSVSDKVGQFTVASVSLSGIYDRITVNKVVEAGISNATVAAQNKIDVLAVSSDTLTSYLGAASVGLVAGAANIANIKSAATTKAYITGGTTNNAGTGAVTVAAKSTANIQLSALTAALGLTAAAGGGIGLAEITNATTASVGGTLNTKGNLAVNAASTETITSALGAGAIGSAAIAAAVSVNTIRSTTAAAIDASALVNQTAGYTGVTTQDISVTATNTASITDNVGAAAVGLIGAGGAIGVETIQTAVTATIGTNAKVSAGRHVSVQATGTKTLVANAGSASAGLLTANGAVIIGNIGGNAAASGSKLSGIGIAEVTGFGAFGATSGKGTTASIAVGAGVNSGLATPGTITVAAKDTDKATAKAGSIAAGLLSAGAGYADVKFGNITSASAGGALSATGSVIVKAETTNNSSSADASAGSVAAAGATLVSAYLTDSSATKAWLENNTQITKATNGVSVTATQSITQFAKAGINTYSIASLANSDSNASSNNTLSASIGTGVIIGTEGQKVGAITFNATGTYANDAQTKGSSYGIVSGASNTATTNTAYGITTSVNTNAKIYSSGAVKIQSYGYADSISKVHGVSGAALAIGSGTATAKIIPQIKTEIANGAIIYGSSIEVLSQQKYKGGWGSNTSEIGAVAIVTASASGLGTVTTDTATAEVNTNGGNPSSQVVIGSATLNATGNVNIYAAADDHMLAKASFDSSFTLVGNSNLRAYAYENSKKLYITIGAATIDANSLNVTTYNYTNFYASATVGTGASLLNSRSTAEAYGGVRNGYASSNIITIGNASGASANITTTGNQNILAQNSANGDVYADVFSSYSFTGTQRVKAYSYYYADNLEVRVNRANLTGQNISIRAETGSISIRTVSNAIVSFTDRKSVV